jgi:hypothetical protein
MLRKCNLLITCETDVEVSLDQRGERAPRYIYRLRGVLSTQTKDTKVDLVEGMKGVRSLRSIGGRARSDCREIARQAEYVSTEPVMPMMRHRMSVTLPESVMELACNADSK